MDVLDKSGVVRSLCNRTRADPANFPPELRVPFHEHSQFSAGIGPKNVAAFRAHASVAPLCLKILALPLVIMPDEYLSQIDYLIVMGCNWREQDKFYWAMRKNSIRESLALAGRADIEDIVKDFRLPAGVWFALCYCHLILRLTEQPNVLEKVTYVSFDNLRQRTVPDALTPLVTKFPSNCECEPLPAGAISTPNFDDEIGPGFFKFLDTICPRLKQKNFDPAFIEDVKGWLLKVSQVIGKVTQSGMKKYALDTIPEFEPRYKK